MSGGGGFEVPTTPIGPGRDGRPRLVVALLIAIVAGAFVIARVSTDADPRRLTVTPGPTVADVQASATPLPQLQWFTGSEAPLDDVLLEAGHIRRLELANARLMDDALALPGRDLLLPAPRGGTICLCWQGSRFDSDDERRLDLVRRDSDEREISRTTITAIDGLDRREPPDGPTRITIEPSPDGRFAYLGRATRSATRWQVSLDVIDLDAESIVDTVDLIAGPSVGSARIVSIAAPQLRVAPDGRHLLISAGVVRDPLIGPGSTSRAWIIELDDRRIGRIVEADAIVDWPPGSCDWIDFATSELIAQGGCVVQTEGADQRFEIRRHDLQGRDLGSLVVASWRARSGELLLDATRGIAYAWDQDSHAIGSVDLLDGVERSVYSAVDVNPPGAVLSIGPRPTAGRPTTWADGRSTIEGRGPRTLVGSPDGLLLYAVGVGSVPEASSGVWVFDAQTLETVERWPAAAAYTSIALLENGRWLAAIGRPGVTSDGNPASWGTSLTVHDATTGRPVLVVGDLRTDSEVTFAWLEQPASIQ
jgi:hypothetical protein